MNRGKGRAPHPHPTRTDLQKARLSGVELDALKTSLLEDSPLSVAPTKASVGLPEVALPALDGIHVEIPPPPTVTARDVEERLRQRRALKSRQEARGRGAPVQPGDDVVVTFVGFEGGEPKPGAAALHVLLSDRHDPMPGMREALVGCGVGDSRTVHLDVPYAVRVEAAHPVVRVRLVEEDEEKQRDAARREARAQRSRWVLELQSRVIDAVRRRASLDVPASAIDAALKARWAESEGRALAGMGIPPEEQRASLEAWQRAPERREDARRSLEASLLVEAYAREREVFVETSDVVAFIAPLIKDLGGQPREVLQAMAEDRARTRQLYEQVLHIKCIERLTREVVGDDVVDAVVRMGEPSSGL